MAAGRRTNYRTATRITITFLKPDYMQRHLTPTLARIGIFRTNIGTMHARKRVISAICNTFEVASCNVDIEDCDKVLRVVDMRVDERSIIQFVQQQGFECE